MVQAVDPDVHDVKEETIGLSEDYIAIVQDTSLEIFERSGTIPNHGETIAPPTANPPTSTSAATVRFCTPQPAVADRAVWAS